MLNRERHENVMTALNQLESDAMAIVRDLQGIDDPVLNPDAEEHVSYMWVEHGMLQISAGIMAVRRGIHVRPAQPDTADR